jgi:hypothetical protein
MLVGGLYGSVVREMKSCAGVTVKRISLRLVWFGLICAVGVAGISVLVCFVAGTGVIVSAVILSSLGVIMNAIFWLMRIRRAAVVKK